MLKIFKKHRKKEEIKIEIPMEQKVAEVLSGIFNSDSKINLISFPLFKNELLSIDKGQFFSVADGTDIYSLTLLICGETEYTNKIIHKLSEIEGQEFLQYNYDRKFYKETLWSLCSDNIYSYKSTTLNYYICINIKNPQKEPANIISIKRNSQFILGKLLINTRLSNNPGIHVLYNKLDFSDKDKYRIDINHTVYKSTISREKENFTFFYIFKRPEEIKPEYFFNFSTSIIKSIIKEQVTQLNDTLKDKFGILNIEPFEKNIRTSHSHIILYNTLTYGNTGIEVQVLFPKRLLSLFPDFSCRTIKGRILQINKYLFRNKFENFYKEKEDLIFTEFISIITDRDLSLICQNFFLSKNFNTEILKKLFYYKTIQGDKTVLKNIPFSNRGQFLSHMPVIIREKFVKNKIYAESYNEMIEINNMVLENIYLEMKNDKLLLSYKARFILEKEYGAKEKETKIKRLRKLINEKKYINILNNFDKKDIQILLNNMKSIVLSDTLIYQTDELIKLKPYLSKTRFTELREDVRFTQEKVKSNQIDINRICDSIETFNNIIHIFTEEEKKKRGG